jgi:antitoxin (DNA-binding transcriptional repressor) of toxin-antitoxin stability system
MTAITVGEINTNFPEILKRVRLGEEVGILQGHTRIPVAMIVPYILKKNIQKQEVKSMKGFLKEYENSNLVVNEKDFYYSLSERVLAKDWLNKEEDEAWKDL